MTIIHRIAAAIAMAENGGCMPSKITWYLDIVCYCLVVINFGVLGVMAGVSGDAVTAIFFVGVLQIFWGYVREERKRIEATVARKLVTLALRHAARDVRTLNGWDAAQEEEYVLGVIDEAFASMKATI